MNRLGTGLFRIVYSSQPFGYDQATLNGILLDARRCNARDSVTGALVCRHDIYLQLLEGPEQYILAAFERIKQDDRHLNVAVLVSRPATSRLFGKWAMLHDPARSWIWTQSDIADGKLDAASEKDVEAIFENLAEKAQSEFWD